MPVEPDARDQLARQGRLWLLSLICATVGAATVWRTDNLLSGIGAFLVALAVFGIPLWTYERYRKRRRQEPPPARSTDRGRRR